MHRFDSAIDSNSAACGHACSILLTALHCIALQYACRKTLADSRPRVRGRFAKNDDYGEPSRVMQNHEEYDHMVNKVVLQSETQIFE